MTAKKCKAINQDGSPCNGFAGADGYCFTHSPGKAKQRSAARKAGGRGRKTPHSNKNAPGVIRDMPGVMLAIDYVWEEALILNNTLERGRLLVSIVGSYISAIEGGDFAKRLESLEESIYGKS